MLINALSTQLMFQLGVCVRVEVWFVTTLISLEFADIQEEFLKAPHWVGCPSVLL